MEQNGAIIEQEEQKFIEPESFQALIDATYQRLKGQYGQEAELANLFDVDEQMEMWDKINVDEGQANKLLTEGMKHGNQQTNIVNKMSESSLLNCQGDKDLIYVEYGAGKAGLSSYVALELAEVHKKESFEKSKVSFLVIDRDARRYKKDKYVR